MIQRIQTVYLALAAVLLAVTAFSASMVSDSEPIAIAATIIAAAVGLSALVTIFLFKRRVRQFQVVGWVVIGSYVVLIALALWIFTGGRLETLTAADNMNDVVIAGASALLASILLFLSKRAIKKDIDLVKSMDRIR